MGRAGQRTLQLQEHPASVKRENLYLVVQKGRLFQQEHPEVPVILDRRRFLLVELDPKRAHRLKVGDVPCYTLCPFEDNQVIFDMRVPTATRVPIACIQNLAI